MSSLYDFNLIQEVALIDYLAEKAEKYLKKMGKKVKFSEKYKMFFIKESFKIDNEMIDLGFIILFIIPRWVQILVPLFSLRNLGKDVKYKLFKLLLKLNHEIFDTEFEYCEPLDFIMISNEIHLDGFVYDSFEEEYEAILMAIKSLIEDAQKEIPEFDIIKILRRDSKRDLDDLVKYLLEKLKKEEKDTTLT